jgi:hypothetical protein
VSKGPSNSAGNTTRATSRFLLDIPLLIFAITFSLMSFHQQPPPLDSYINRADRSTDVSSTPARYVPATAKDQGDFKLCYEPRTNFRMGFAGRRVGMGIEGLIDSLNERMALPFDIVIAFKECDGPEAFYDDQTHEITLSHDLIADYYDLFSVEIRKGAKLDQAVRGAVAFTFFHELGHALIDAWKLPITGKEEDAADQFANLILIEEIEEGEQMALDGALALKIYAELASGEEKIYWDEHSLDEQRFYDTLCMLYGHGPEKYAYLVNDRSLPLERAELCNEAYAKVKASWQTLLAPHAGILQNAASKIRMR